MKNLGYYNGKYDLIENMTIPMNDRAVYFGDGIYEAAYSRNYIVYALEEHMDRLYESARKLGINIPLSRAEFCGLINELVKKVESDTQLVYWQVSRGTEMRNHAPSAGLTANILITLKPMSIKDTYAPMKAITLEDVRFLLCNMKTLNLLPAVLASDLAVKSGVDESVLHRGPIVTECAHSNISILTSNGILQTHPADNLILAGIARAHLIDAAKANGMSVLEKPFTLEEMMNADEIIISSSSCLCRPVCEIDKIGVGSKSPETLKKLQDFLLTDFLSKTELSV